jgi:hypothetical protein
LTVLSFAISRSIALKIESFIPCLLVYQPFARTFFRKR